MRDMRLGPVTLILDRDRHKKKVALYLVKRRAHRLGFSGVGVAYISAKPSWFGLAHGQLGLGHLVLSWER